MKNKKIIFLLLLLSGFIFVNFVLAADNTATQKNQLDFKPSMSIPGLYNAGDIVSISPSSLAEYIVAIYRYGGMFAGVVAMFMLVYAGWEWLLAGGNSGKISRAKEKISGTLMGLALLFGGYLLLSLISKNLVSFNTLNTTIADIPCTLYKTETTCPGDRCHWVADNFVTPNNDAACISGSVSVKKLCSTQKNNVDCTSLSNICRWDGSKCTIQEKCSITQEDFDLFAADSGIDPSFTTHCCATNFYGGGYSNYRYAIFGTRDFNLSCETVCGAGSPERPMSECQTSLGWDANMDGSGGW